MNIHCLRCDKEWDIPDSLECPPHCPFCGRLLFDVDYRDLDVLRDYIAKNNITGVSDRKSFLALISDLLPNNRKEQTMIRIALNEGIIDMLLDAYSKNTESSAFDLYRIKSLSTSQLGFDEDYTQRMISTLLYIFGIDGNEEQEDVVYSDRNNEYLYLARQQYKKGNVKEATLLYSVSISSGNKLALREFVATAEYKRPNNISLKKWYEWINDLSGYEGEKAYQCNLVLSDCYNYGFGVRQDLREGMLNLRSIEDVNIDDIPIEYLLEYVVRTTFPVIDVEMEPSNNAIQFNNEIINSIWFRDSEIAEEIRGYVRNYNRTKNKEYEIRSYYLMSNLYESNPTRRSFWLWLIVKNGYIVNNANFNSTTDCVLELIKSNTQSNNEDIAEKIIDCILLNENTVDIAFSKITDRTWNKKYMWFLRYIGTSSRIMECENDDTKAKVYYYVLLYEKSVDVQRTALLQLRSIDSEKAREYLTILVEEYPRRRYLSLKKGTMDIYADCVISVYSHSDSIYQDAITELGDSMYKEEEIQYFKKKLATGGVTPAFVDYFNYAVQQHDIGNYNELVEMAKQCEEDSLRYYCKSQNIIQTLDETIPGYMSWYEFAFQKELPFNGRKYGIYLINGTEISDAVKGCDVLLNIGDEEYLFEYVGKMISDQEKKLEAIVNHLMSSAYTEDLIIDNPLWFVRGFIRNGIWKYSEIKDISGERLSMYFNGNDRRFLGAMCILENHGIDVTHLENYIYDNMERFIELSPDYSSYI